MSPARLLLVALLVALAASTVEAEPRRAAAEAQARELYKKGMMHYQLGDFDTAIGEFKAAYELTSAPGLLFNLAQVQRMKRDFGQALHFYRMYLRLDPQAANRADVEALIVEVQRSLDDEQRAKQARLRPEPAPAPPPPVVVAPAIVSPPAPSPPSPRRWKTELALGAVAVAVGAGLVGGGIALGLRAASDADVLARDSMVGTNAWDASRQALERDGQSATSGGIALDVIGAALVATGVVVGVLGLRERAAARRFSSTSPSTARGSTALWWTAALTARGAGWACAF